MNRKINTFVTTLLKSHIDSLSTHNATQYLRVRWTAVYWSAVRQRFFFTHYQATTRFPLQHKDSFKTVSTQDIPDNIHCGQGYVLVLCFRDQNK